MLVIADYIMLGFLVFSAILAVPNIYAVLTDGRYREANPEAYGFAVLIASFIVISLATMTMQVIFLLS